jgi:glycosyltransferase involved in cell wall biosynthesis
VSTRAQVSVVMAVRHAMPYLGDALDSVVAQTHPAFEIVVVAGPSTDGSEAVARTYPNVVVLPESGRGFASAWNQGIAASRGDYIAILDSDDRWAIDKLERQLAAMAADPSLDGAIGHVRFFLEPGCAPPTTFNPTLLSGSYVAHMPGALLARRSVFDRIGDFGIEWTIASDIDWFARAKDAGLRFAVVSDVVVHKRVHDRNLSYLAARTPALNDEILRLLHRSIRRQRSAAVKPLT